MKVPINGNLYKVEVKYDKGVYKERGRDRQYNYMIITFDGINIDYYREVTLADDDPNYIWKPEDLLSIIAEIQCSPNIPYKFPCY